MYTKIINRYLLLTALCFIGGQQFARARQTENFVQYVHPEIGTAHCRWFHYTPGAYPFGMAKPAPATNGHLGNAHGWEATGYDFRDSSIEGFPNFHEFQIGESSSHLP